ncbi:MAG: flagellar biosynthesis protein FliR [Campylobacterota bacterium]|nr:flagellar biosynthesis protein FliR [Campylobacterota bacterium]
MLDFVQFLSSASVVTFFLLFTRVGTLFTFMPFFSSEVISITVKSAIAFYLTIFFFPLVPIVSFELTPSNVFLAVIMEILFGFSVGLILRFAFAAIQYAGEQISFVMGFSMATSIDPQTAQSVQILSNFFNTLAVLIFLAFDGHHLLLFYLSSSLQTISLGGFLLTQSYIDFVISEMSRLFVVGFMLAFPIIAISLLSDIIFGMIMKTVPSFNLLVIGFPAKIAVSFVVLVTVLGSMMFVFKEEFMRIFNILSSF